MHTQKGKIQNKHRVGDKPKETGRAPKAIQGIDGQMTDMNYKLFFPSVKGGWKNTVRDKYSAVV